MEERHGKEWGESSRSKRSRSGCALTAVAVLGIVVLLLTAFVIGACLPGGIRLGRFYARANFGDDAQVSPPPLSGVNWSPHRQRHPLVYDPNGPEIQVGPEIPWTEGGTLWVRAFHKLYKLRVESPSGRYEIAPPLP